jgi:EmrB/QacA subfamily drug resistance transporter
MLLTGVGVFLIGSGLCGLSQSMNELIAFRALQGLGAGAIFPVALAAVGDLFDARERARYQGLIAAVAGLSFLIGPFMGGWITDNITWHWVFYVNVPFGVVAVLALARLLPNRRRASARARDLDYLGILVFVAGVVPMLIGLTNKGNVNRSTGQLYDWSASNVAGPIILGAVLLIGFALVEMRAQEPIIPLDLFRNRDYTLSMIGTFLFGLSGFIGIIFMPRFYQTVRGVNATASGYYIWSLLLGVMGGNILSGVLISKFGRYKLLITGSGLLLVVGGYLMTHVAAGTPDWELWAWMLLLGLGVGPSSTAFTVVVQSLVPNHRLGVASSTLTVSRQIASTTGLAIGGTIFSSTYQDQLPHSVSKQGVPAGIVDMVTELSTALEGIGNRSAFLSHALPPAGRTFIPQILAGANDAFATAIGGMFWMAIVAGCAALVCALLIRDVELKRRGA